MKKYNYKRSKLPLLLYFLCFVIVFSFIPSGVMGEMLSVHGDNINIRSGPGKQYRVRWEYGDGFPLKILKKKGKWVQVKDFEGDSGWVYKKLLVDKPRMIVKANRNQNKNINIRNGPGTKTKIIGKAYYGVVFTTVEQRSGWVKVRHESGLEGWIKRNLLWGY